MVGTNDEASCAQVMVWWVSYIKIKVLRGWPALQSTDTRVIMVVVVGGLTRKNKYKGKFRV